MNDTTLPITTSPSSKKTNPRIRRTEKGAGKGFGLHDWMTLLRRSKDLAQRKGSPLRNDITLSEISTHDKPYDGWMVLRGKVYNIAPYLAYHPGGSSIVEKALGKDATELFDRYHAWVNIDTLIGPLLVGYLLVEKTNKKSGDCYIISECGDDNDNDGGSKGVSNNATGDSNGNIVVPVANASSATSPSANDLGFAMPKPRPPKNQPITSLLSSNNNEDEEEKEEELI